MYPNYTHEGDRVKIPAGSAVVKNEMVKLSSNTVIPMTKGCQLYGVALNSAAQGELVTVSKKGVYRFTAESGVNFNYGDVVYAYTSITLYAGSADGCQRITEFVGQHRQKLIFTAVR